MTLRELLDAATPGEWTWITDPHEGRMLVADWDGATHLVVTEIRANEPLIALAPELAALVLDMADALRADAHYPENPGTCRLCALLARLDRISTQTERGAGTCGPAEKEGWGSMDLLTGGTAQTAEKEGTWCVCGQPHCPECTIECCQDAGDCGEDCGTA